MTASIQLSDRRPQNSAAAGAGIGTRRGARPAIAPTTASRSRPGGVLDELDKVHPVTGELIPNEPEGYLAVNHLWDAASADGHASRCAQ